MRLDGFHSILRAILQASMGVDVFYGNLPGFTGFYWVLVGLTGFDWI